MGKFYLLWFQNTFLLTIYQLIKLITLQGHRFLFSFNVLNPNKLTDNFHMVIFSFTDD